MTPTDKRAGQRSSGDTVGDHEVYLVVPPYAPLEHPSLGLGILKAALAEQEITATVNYLNLTYADEIGLGRYSFFGSTGALALLGEWTFARAAFPDAEFDEQEYFDLTTSLLAQRYGATESRASARLLLDAPDLRTGALEVREVAERLIDRSARAIVAAKPRIVGCSSTFQQHLASLALLRRIRQLAPEIATVLGGANCDGPMGQANHDHFPWLDVVVAGEADLLFPDLCRQLLDHGPTLKPSQVPSGVLVRGVGETTAASSSRTVIDNLDKTPIPDVDEYYEQLRGLSVGQFIRPIMLIETSRGCWWGARKHCTFCGLNGNGMAFRSKSPQRVLHELEVLSRRYGNQFAAVDNILDMKYFRSVLPSLVKLGKPYDLFYETKANLSREQMKLLAQAGVSVIQPGLESLHDAPLKEMLKGNSVATNLQLLKWAREYGIAVTWFILSGLPVDEESWYDEMADLTPLLTHLPPPLSLNAIEWHRFSPYHQRAAEYGLDLRPARTYSHIYPLPESALANLAYVFESRTPSLEPESPAKARLRQALRDWQKEWEAATLAELRMEETPDGLLLIDTRGCRTQPSHLLSGLAAAIYRGCDAGRGRERLLRELRGGSHPEVAWSEIEPELARLVANKLMVEVSGLYLSLATGATADHQARAAFGHVDVFSYLADRQASRMTPRHMQADIPLQHLFAN